MEFKVTEKDKLVVTFKGVKPGALNPSFLFTGFELDDKATKTELRNLKSAINIASQYVSREANVPLPKPIHHNNIDLLFASAITFKIRRHGNYYIIPRFTIFPHAEYGDSFKALIKLDSVLNYLIWS